MGDLVERLGLGDKDEEGVNHGNTGLGVVRESLLACLSLQT